MPATADAPKATAPVTVLPGTLRLLLQNDTLRQLDEALLKLSDSIVSYRVEIFHESSEVPLVPASTIARDFGKPVQEIVLTSIPKGSHLLVVTGIDAFGAAVGSFSQKVEIGENPAEVLISALSIFKQTREVGRVSVGSTGGQFLRESGDVDISDDGRFVAFVTSEREAADQNAERDVYVRDRVGGTTQRLSFLPNSTGVSFADIGKDCSGPRLSKDFLVFSAGGRIYLRDRNGSGVTSQIGLSDAGTQAGTFLIDSLTAPSISADSTLVACSGRATSVTDFSDVRSVTLVQTLQANTGAVLSTRVILNRTDAVLSKRGRSVFYKPTNVSGLDTESIRKLNLDTNQESIVYTPVLQGARTEFAPDSLGLSVVIQDSGRLKLANASTGVVKTLVSNQFQGVVGRPAISGDGRRQAFWTSDGLVKNDLNGLHDVYVLDSHLERISVAGDGTASQGGYPLLDRSTTLALASDANRVAFVSPDSQLVPDDTNLQNDVFSANVPTSGKLYAVSTSGNLLRVNAADDATGVETPTVIAAQLQTVRRIIVDAVTNRLYVLQTIANGNSQLLVFNNASGLSGSPTPARTINLAGTPGALDMAVDIDRDVLYLLSAAGLDRFVSLSTMGGSPTAAARRSGVVGDSLLVDTRRDELYVSSSNASGLTVFGSVSTLSSATPVLRQSNQVGGRLEFDIAPRGAGGTINSSNLLAIRNSATTANFFLVTGNGSDPGVPLAKSIDSRLSVSSTTGREFGQFAVDRTTGNIYVVNSESNQIEVHPGGPGPANPSSRIFGLSVPLQPVVALDRSR